MVAPRRRDGRATAAAAVLCLTACGALLLQTVLEARGHVVRAAELGSFGIEEEPFTDMPKSARCDNTDKWSPTTCDDPFPSEIPESAEYTPEFVIPRGIGYYHAHDSEIDDPKYGDRARAPGSISKRPGHNTVGWVWGQSAPTDFEHGEPVNVTVDAREGWWGAADGSRITVHEGENITGGIGYYTPDKFINELRPVLGDRAPIQDVPEEGDVIPRGLGFYSGALETAGYEEAHLRDPSYRDWAYALAYPQHPDYESRANFFDEMDVFPCTASGEPMRC